MTEGGAERDAVSEEETPAAAEGLAPESEPGTRGAENRPAAEEIESLRQECAEQRDQVLRLAAELENQRRRSARELENARKYGIERLAQALLPVYDSLEAGLAAENLGIETLLEGQGATLRLLQDALDQVGVETIDPEGEPFDPTRHEAMSLLPSDRAEPGSVVEVIQKGYAIEDRLLRPARVVVAKAPDAEDSG